MALLGSSPLPAAPPAASAPSAAEARPLAALGEPSDGVLEGGAEAAAAEGGAVAAAEGGAVAAAAEGGAVAAAAVPADAPDWAGEFEEGGGGSGGASGSSEAWPAGAATDEAAFGDFSTDVGAADDAFQEGGEKVTDEEFNALFGVTE